MKYWATNVKLLCLACILRTSTSQKYIFWKISKHVISLKISRNKLHLSQKKIKFIIFFFFLRKWYIFHVFQYFSGEKHAICLEISNKICVAFIRYRKNTKFEKKFQKNGNLYSMRVIEKENMQIKLLALVTVI